MLAINLHTSLVLVNALLPRLVEAHATIVLIGSIAVSVIVMSRGTRDTRVKRSTRVGVMFSPITCR